MIDLNKEESYAYLMVVSTTDGTRMPIDYEVIPFKSRNDIEKAIVNIVVNNIKYYNDIANISYNHESNLDTFICAKIEYKNGISKLYHAVRRRIHEVK